MSHCVDAGQKFLRAWANHGPCCWPSGTNERKREKPRGAGPWHGESVAIDWRRAMAEPLLQRPRGEAFGIKGGTSSGYRGLLDIQLLAPPPCLKCTAPPSQTQTRRPFPKISSFFPSQLPANSQPSPRWPPPWQCPKCNTWIPGSATAQCFKCDR